MKHVLQDNPFEPVSYHTGRGHHKRGWQNNPVKCTCVEPSRYQAYCTHNGVKHFCKKCRVYSCINCGKRMV